MRQDKGRDQQAEVFSRVCRLAKEVGKPVVIHCRGTASTAKECLWIMKSNLPKDQMVYWHHFNETEKMTREVEAAFPNVVFGVAPAILKEQLDDQLEINNKQQSTTHGNVPKGSGSYLRPKTHIQHTYPQHLSTSTQTSTNHKSTHCNRMW